jgi:hypothetical protein
MRIIENQMWRYALILGPLVLWIIVLPMCILAYGVLQTLGISLSDVLAGLSNLIAGLMKLLWWAIESLIELVKIVVT